MSHRPESISLGEGRFSRLEAIKWWDQSLLREARVLVVGAGALGNEVIKNLSLLGVGRLAIVDMDRIEASNLSRSVLFREADEAQPKAVVAARAAQEIYPDLRAHPIVGNLMSDVGLGWFRWAQVVVAALDNREARVFVNSACAKVGRAWIDGGIDILNGLVRAFDPPKTACYECTMGQADWDLLAKRRSCSLLARFAASHGGTPTTPTTASIIGAIQAQEVVKRLHGLESLSGSGFVFEGLSHQSYSVSYPILEECPWHQRPADIDAFDQWGSDTPLATIAQEARQKLGGLDAIDFSRELVERIVCPRCGLEIEVFQPLERLTQEQARCAACQGECVPVFLHSLACFSPLMGRTARQLGLPAWDVVWARYEDKAIGIELAKDRLAETQGDWRGRQG